MRQRLFARSCATCSKYAIDCATVGHDVNEKITSNTIAGQINDDNKDNNKIRLTFEKRNCHETSGKWRLENKLPRPVLKHDPILQFEVKR